MKKLYFFLVVLVLLLSACASDAPQQSSAAVLFDAPKFSKVTVEQLKGEMGEPEEVIAYPLNGVEMDVYVYDKGKYEFYLHEGIVVQVNLNNGAYWGYDDSVFELPSNDRTEVLALFNIENTKTARTTANTNVALKFERISEDVYQVWLNDIQDGTFGTVKITYDPNYF